MCSKKKKKVDINVKAFNMLIKKNEAKATKNIFNVILNPNSMVQLVIQIKNRTIKPINVNVKFSISAKNIIVGILADVFSRIASIQKVM